MKKSIRSTKNRADNLGTFGNSKAALVLDEILDRIDNEKLTRCFVVFITHWKQDLEKISSFVTDKAFKQTIRQLYKKTHEERLDLILANAVTPNGDRVVTHDEEASLRSFCLNVMSVWFSIYDKKLPQPFGKCHKNEISMEAHIETLEKKIENLERQVSDLNQEMSTARHLVGGI